MRPLTFDEANARDYAEIENLEKGGPIANADYFLTNTVSKESLLKELDEVLAKNGITT